MMMILLPTLSKKKSVREITESNMTYTSVQEENQDCSN
jgi:hypothetical protein